MTALYTLGRDVPTFGKRGDRVWVVQFSEVHTWGVTEEVWINAKTGKIRRIFPPIKED